MADKKVSELDAIIGTDTAADDLFLIVDTSGTVTKKITRAELNNAIEQDVLENISITNLTSDLSTNGNDINFGDNDKAVFGAGSDLQISHTGTYSLIADTSGTGPLRVVTNQFQLNNAADTANLFKAIEGGAVTAYYNGSAKLATTSGGIDVTGTVTADGLAVDASGGGLTFSGGGNTFISATSSPLIFQTSSGTERMRITGTGLVGIGTSSPSNPLHISSSAGEAILISNSSASGNSQIKLDGATDFQIGTGQASSGFANKLFIYDATNAATRMVITNGGNVGIGTSSPTAKLELNKGSAGSLATFTDGVSTNFNFSTSGTVGSFGTDAGSTSLALKTAGSERMRIDSSGNVLVGKTSADNGATVGAEINANDTAYFTRSGGAGVVLNRKTSDGNIAVFQKDGTTVGQIGAEAGDLFIGTDDTGLEFVNGVNAILPVNGTTGADRDNAIDLGISSVRFKDLYLSGGAYLGGTAAANKLDDYEEGTWTPTDNSGAGLTFTNANGYYTKVGDLVFAAFRLTYPTTSNTNMAALAGLPFTAGSIADSMYGGTATYHQDNIDMFQFLVGNNNTSITIFYGGANQRGVNNFSGKPLRGFVVYKV